MIASGRRSPRAVTSRFTVVTINCACATCHGYAQSEWLDKLKPPSDDEQLMLTNVADECPPNS
jgi:hypothetical protein